MPQGLNDMAAVELPQGEETLLGAGPDFEGQGFLAERELQEPVPQAAPLALAWVQLDDILCNPLNAPQAQVLH